MKKLLLLMFVSISLNLFSQDKVTTRFCIENNNCDAQIRDSEKREFVFSKDSVVVYNLAKHLPYKSVFNVYKVEDRDGSKTFTQNTRWYFCKDNREGIYEIIIHFYDDIRPKIQIYTVIDEIHNTYLTYSD